MAVIQPIGQSSQNNRSYGGGNVIAPLSNFNDPILERKQPVQTQQNTQTNVSSNQNKNNLISGGAKLVARSAVGFADLITEGLDFTTKFIVNNPVFNPIESVLPKESKQMQSLNKWKNITTNITSQPKLFIDKLQQTEYIRPSDEWTNSSLKDKLTKRLGETVAVLGPSIIPSFALYAINPLLGLSVTTTATANDVRDSAVENGVSTKKADLLGLGTGILVGALDHIVPDELFTPKEKSLFLTSLAKRIIPTSLKEAATEIAQEDIQLAAEATFRKDLKWDEVKTRNALSGLGGLLGGSGATMVVGTINTAFNQDILLSEDIDEKTDTNTEVKNEEKTFSPEEAIGVVVGQDLENTEVGNKIVKESVIAQQEGRNIAITPNKNSLDIKVVDNNQQVSQEKNANISSNDIKVSKTAEQKTEGKTEPKVEKPKEKKFEKEVAVPKAQLPVGEGKEKVSRLEARAKGLLDNVDPKIAESLGLSTYNQVAKKENIRKALNYVTANPSEALKVITGEIEAPSGVLKNSVYVAMEQLAKEDVGIARKVASLEATRLGQEISILTELDPNSTVKAMRDVIKIREEVFDKRYKNRKASEVKEKIAEEIKSNIKKPGKADWNSFLDTIKC